MPNPKYAFISAYLKGEESKVVNSEHIDRMLKASDIQEALEIIKETDIGSYLEGLPIRTFDDLDKYLWEYFARRIGTVESFKFLPKQILKVSKAYVVKYDVLNIKAALQGISTGKEVDMIPLGTIYSNGLLDKLSQAKNPGDIVELLIRSKLQNYVPVLEGYQVEGGIKSKLLAETKLDSEYYKNMLNVSKAIVGGYVLSKILGLTIDLTNLQIVTRAIIWGIGTEIAEYTIAGGYMITGEAIKDLLSSELAEVSKRLGDTPYQGIAKEVLSSYEATKSIAVVSEIIDKHKFRLAKEMLSLRISSPLVMAWYLILKEGEIRNLRLILKAIYDGLPLKEIRGYLVW